MPRKLTYPRCENDQFKVRLSERQIVTEKPGRRKVNIIEMLHITCTKCGWGKPLYENGEWLL